jgi:hypothetical protein
MSMTGFSALEPSYGFRPAETIMAGTKPGHDAV